MTKNAGQSLIEILRKPFTVTNDVSPDIQAMLNKPTVMVDEKIDPQDAEFLEMLIKKVDQGIIKLYTPATLLNTPVYDALSPESKAKADYDILNLLNKIREIHRLWQSGDHESYQIINLIHALRLTKERLEAIGGDVFII